ALELAVVMPGRMRCAIAYDVPEAEIDVQRLGLERIQWKSLARRRRPDRADPHRKDADLGVKEIEELRRAMKRNIDILDHRLRMHAHEPVPRAGETVPAVPAHDLLVGDRVQAIASVQPPQQRVLRANVL